MSSISSLRLSALGVLVRRHDPDRYLTALFAPEDRRELLFLLYAFNHELARAREAVSEPTLALIRLHWWREVVEGVRRRHEVAGPLGEVLDAGLIAPGPLLAMIDGREVEAEPGVATLADWRSWLMATGGGVAVTAGQILGADDEVLGRLRLLGAAYGAAGQRRSVAALARQGRCMLPADLMNAHGLTAEAVIARPALAAPVLAELAEAARTWLRAGGRMPRGVIAAALPAVLARRDLRRNGAAARGVGDQMAVLAAVLLSRI